MSDKSKEIPVPEVSQDVQVTPGVPKPTKEQIKEGVERGKRKGPSRVLDLVDQLGSETGMEDVWAEIGDKKEKTSGNPQD